MPKYKFVCDTGFVGARHEEVVEFDKPPTSKELDEFLECWVNGLLDSWWTSELEDDE